MAREFYGYFDSIDDDVREYDAAQFAHILKAAVQSGVSSHEGGLEVTADGLGMDTRVAYGGCVIEGHVYVLEDDGGSPFTLTHEPSGTADRIDRVVVRLENDQSARRMGVYLLTGTPSASPQPPALTRNAQVWELSLARVRVRASATAVAPEDVTDERGDEAACGYAVPRWLDRAVAARTLNTLTATEAGYALDARQGKALDDKITRLSAEAARTARYSATLTAAGWSASAPYQQTVSAEGILATDDPFVDVDMSGASGSSQGTALTEAWGFVGRVTAGNGQITAYCYEEKPAVNLPVILKVVR